MALYESMFEIVSNALFGGNVLEETRQALKQDGAMKELYKLSAKHDIVHLVGYGLQKSDLLQDPIAKNAFDKAQFVAVYRYENIKHELDAIFPLFEQEGIDCIVLKGSAIRKYYTEPWLRTSCDIDLLIKEEDCDRAIKSLSEKLGYRYEGKLSHDHQLYSPSNVHLELHFMLIEEDTVLKSEKLLENVWDYIVPMGEYNHIFEMNDEMFYYYHMVHMAKHLIFGGCGIKPFIDMIILNQNVQYGDSAYQLLKDGGLDKFETSSYKLAKVWFLGEKGDGSTERLGEFVISGGVYGNVENRVASNQSENGGVLGYMIHRIFVPYKVLVIRYPGLENRKLLMPFYQIRRWFDLLFGGRAKYSFNELKINKIISKKEVDSVNNMIDELGLR